MRRRRVSKRRSSRRRVRRVSRRPVNRLSGSLTPNRLFLKLKYSEAFGMTYNSASTNATVYQFRVNSIHDPNFTGVGHQPLGHDEWSVFYSRYRVRGMRYVITFTNIEAISQQEVAVTLRPNNVYDTLMDTIRESPSCVYKAILGVEGSGQNNKVVRGYASVAKVRGVSKARVNVESDFQALIGSNPAFVPMLTVYMKNQDSATDSNIRVRVDLVYHVELSDRKQQYQS